MSDRDQGAARGGPHGCVVPPVPPSLLQRLEALLGERQEIIVALEALTSGDDLGARLLRRRLLQLANEQAHVLDELDVLVRARGECASRRAANPPLAVDETGDEAGAPAARRDRAADTDGSRSTLPTSAPHRAQPTLKWGQ